MYVSKGFLKSLAAFHLSRSHTYLPFHEEMRDDTYDSLVVLLGCSTTTGVGCSTTGSY
jgi:hypothetical protein